MNAKIASGRAPKDDLARIIRETIRERGLTQAEAANVLGATQPDVSDLVRGKLARFSVDRLLRYLAALGMQVRIQVSSPVSSAAGRGQKTEPSGNGLPDNLRRYFWDYDPETLSLKESRWTIVWRLLEAGGQDAMRWLRSEIGDEELREVLERRRGRGLSPRRLRFWGLVLGLPRERVDAWVAAARREPWARRVRP